MPLILKVRNKERSLRLVGDIHTHLICYKYSHNKMFHITSQHATNVSQIELLRPIRKLTERTKPIRKILNQKKIETENGKTELK